MDVKELARFVREELPLLRKAIENCLEPEGVLGISKEYALTDALSALLALVGRAEPCVEMAAYADNSGGEYPPMCQGCNGNPPQARR